MSEKSEKPPLRHVQLRAMRDALTSRSSSLPAVEAEKILQAFEKGPLRPHPIIKLGAELAAELTPAEHQARRELGRLSARWAKKTTRPLLVSAGLRSKGALWRLKGVGA